MKLLVLSDLHVEFAPFVPDLAAVEGRPGVVVLAGDVQWRQGHRLGTPGLCGQARRLCGGQPRVLPL